MPSSTVPLILDLGCGKKKRVGTIGVDFSDRHDADVIHDLNNFPYPFSSSSVDHIYLDNVLEHLDNPLHVMEEIHRILKPYSTVKVIVPYFRSAYAFHDPTHKHFFTVESFSYYDPKHPICIRYDYTDARFNIEKIVFNEELNNRIIIKLFKKFANIFPRFYERYFSHFVPMDDITFILSKV